jgi:pantothenate kinase-related protein Tda10
MAWSFPFGIFIARFFYGWPRNQRRFPGMKISVCGKGGSGKSTVSALLARNALKRGMNVLVVDADDSNRGLSRMLGFEHPPTPLMALVAGNRGSRKRWGKVAPC